MGIHFGSSYLRSIHTPVHCRQFPGVCPISAGEVVETNCLNSPVANTPFEARLRRWDAVPVGPARRPSPPR